MIKHLAGGIRNPKLTSYINCTLQMLLNFHPFFELLESQNNLNQDNNNSLITILFNLANKMHSSDNSVSADALISFFQIDPNFFSDIMLFLKQLMESLPSDFGSLITVNELSGDSIFEEFQSPESVKMIIFHQNLGYQHQDIIKEFVTQNNIKYELFSIVQVTGNFEVTRNGQYSILIRDNHGWMQCNDTSITAIQDGNKINSIIHDDRSPIELLSYVTDLNLIDFNRRPVKFPINKNISAANDMPYQKRSPSFFPSLFDKEKKKEMHTHNSILSDLSSDDDDDDDVNEIISLLNNENKRVYKLHCKFFDGSVMKIIEEEDIEINNSSEITNKLDQLKKKWNSEYNDSLQYKYFLNSKFVDKISSNEENDITVIFQRKNMAMFNNILFQQNTNSITIEIIVLEAFLTFKGQFYEEQSVADVKSFSETFYQTILKARKAKIFIFLIYGEKVFQVSEEMKISEIKKIIEIENLQFGISFGNDEPSNLAKISIPFFETVKHFKQCDYITRPIKISDTGKMLIEIAKRKFSEESPLQIMCFEDGKFFVINESEYLFNIMDQNIRIQKRINSDSVVFMFKNDPDTPPFTYSLKENQSLYDLTKEIKSYIGDQKITLEYDKTSRNIEKNPKQDYLNGIFSFIYVVKK